MFYQTLNQLFDLLSQKERSQAYRLFGMVLLMALMDMTGVASIMPFLSVLANPAVVESNHYLAAIYRDLEFTDQMAFLYFLGLVVFILLVASILFKALTIYAILRFTHMRNYNYKKVTNSVPGLPMKS